MITSFLHFLRNKISQTMMNFLREYVPLWVKDSTESEGPQWTTHPQIWRGLFGTSDMTRKGMDLLADSCLVQFQWETVKPRGLSHSFGIPFIYLDLTSQIQPKICKSGFLTFIFLLQFPIWIVPFLTYLISIFCFRYLKISST